MQYNETQVPEFTVEFHGITIKCRDVEHVVETVKALVPLEREVPVPTHAEAPIEFANTNPIATAVYDLFRETPSWRRPVEIVKALKKRGTRTKYANVYAVLRYGDFDKQGGKWNLKGAA